MLRARPGHGCVWALKGGRGYFVRGSCAAAAPSDAAAVDDGVAPCPSAVAAIPSPSAPTAVRRVIAGESSWLIAGLHFVTAVSSFSTHRSCNLSICAIVTPSYNSPQLPPTLKRLHAFWFVSAWAS